MWNGHQRRFGGILYPCLLTKPLMLCFGIALWFCGKGTVQFMVETGRKCYIIGWCGCNCLFMGVGFETKVQTKAESPWKICVESNAMLTVNHGRALGASTFCVERFPRLAQRLWRFGDVVCRYAHAQTHKLAVKNCCLPQSNNRSIKSRPTKES